MYFLKRFGIGAIRQRFSKQVRDLQHFFFFHAPCRDGRRADADTTGLENWIGIEWDAIFVYGDAGSIENFLCFLAVNVLRAKIDEHQVIIGSA